MVYAPAMQLKKAMRKHYRAAREALSDAERVRFSEIIERRLHSIPEIAAAQAVLTYVSTGSEVNTHGIIAGALRADIAVFTPVVDGLALRWSRLKRFSDLDLATVEPAQKYLDLQEPPKEAPVLVPGIAFDTSGNRIGQGAGHFDRFLVTHPGTRIGLAFSVQIADDLPTEPHDVPMNYIVTEIRALRF